MVSILTVWLPRKRSSVPRNIVQSTYLVQISNRFGTEIRSEFRFTSLLLLVLPMDLYCPFYIVFCLKQSVNKIYSIVLTY